MKPDKTPVVEEARAAVKPERPICAVCGQYEGDFVTGPGVLRWHQACEKARPDVIAKVKARA